MTGTPPTRPGTAGTGSTSAADRGTGRAGPARCGGTGGCGSTRPTSAARARPWTGTGSTRSPPRCTAAEADDGPRCPVPRLAASERGARRTGCFHSPRAPGAGYGRSVGVGAEVGVAVQVGVARSAGPEVVDPRGLGERLQVVAVHDLGAVVQVDVRDRRQRVPVPCLPDLHPAVQRAAHEQQHGVGVALAAHGVLGTRFSLDRLAHSDQGRRADSPRGRIRRDVHPPRGRSSRARSGAENSITNSRSTCTASTNVASAPVPVAVAGTAYSPPGVVAR